MEYVDKVYEIVKNEAGNLDSIYGDYICHLVGIHGLVALIDNDLVEGCGVVNGRRLYVLIDKKQ